MADRNNNIPVIEGDTDNRTEEVASPSFSGQLTIGSISSGQENFGEIGRHPGAKIKVTLPRRNGNHEEGYREYAGAEVGNRRNALFIGAQQEMENGSYGSVEAGCSKENEVYINALLKFSLSEKSWARGIRAGYELKASTDPKEEKNGVKFFLEVARKIVDVRLSLAPYYTANEEEKGVRVGIEGGHGEVQYGAYINCSDNKGSKGDKEEGEEGCSGGVNVTKKF